MTSKDSDREEFEGVHGRKVGEVSEEGRQKLNSNTRTKKGFEERARRKGTKKELEKHSETGMFAHSCLCFCINLSSEEGE